MHPIRKIKARAVTVASIKWIGDRAKKHIDSELFSITPTCSEYNGSRSNGFLIYAKGPQGNVFVSVQLWDSGKFEISECPDSLNVMEYRQHAAICKAYRDAANEVLPNAVEA